MKIVTATPAITAGAYSAADAVGGKIEFENACSVYKNSGTIVQATLIDKAKQNALIHLVLFDRDFTAVADNAPFDVTDADLANVVGQIEFAVADYLSLADNSVCPLVGDFPFTLVEGGTSLFGQLYVVTSTPTYAAVDDIIVKLIVK
jgi:hypothetical protein